MFKRPVRNKNELLYFICIAGLAAGMAEITWIAIYTSLSQQSSLYIAEQISYTIAGKALNFAALYGIGIHIVLSILLTFIIVLWVIKSHPYLLQSKPRLIAVMCLILSAVWFINFFIILPWLNPVFVNIVPYSVSFISKNLFALTLAFFLCKAGYDSGKYMKT